MPTPKDLLTLEPVRPGLTTKGSFKNSKSEGMMKISKGVDRIGFHPNPHLNKYIQFQIQLQ